MEINKALNVLADYIWTKGPDKVLCIVPSEYAGRDNPVSDAVCDAFNATHYKLSWEEKGKKVKIKFYSADAFGAARNLGKCVSERIVQV
jgi:hypothetical protein